MPRVVAIMVALFAVSASAEPPDESSRRADGARAELVFDEIEVLLAEIEVVVTDRRGDPVAGLARDDFEVFQDGRPVEVTHFQAIGSRPPIAAESTAAESVAAESTAAESTAAESTAAEILYLIIYVDRGYLEPGDLEDVRRALQGFLLLELTPGDRVMLVSASPSLELHQGFTSEPELVVSKLDSIHERPGGGRLAREYQSLLLEMTGISSQAVDAMTFTPDRIARTFISRIQAYTAEVEAEILGTTAQLEQLVGSIAGLPGRRAVLYVGGRVPTAYGRQLYDAWQAAFGRISRRRAEPDPGAGDFGPAVPIGEMPDGGFDSLALTVAIADVDAQHAVQEVAELASAHGVVFHTLDAGSQRDSTSAPGDATLPARAASANRTAVTVPGSFADAMSSLRGLASGTGGRSFTGGRDFGAALARIVGDLRTFYSLGFVPLEPKGESSRIKVRLRPAARRRDGRGRLQVRHPSVLGLKDRDTQAAERTVSALLLEEMDNPLAVEIEAGEPVAAEGGGWRLPLSITVPLAKLALVADGRVHAGRLSIYTATGDLDRVGAVTKAVVPVRIPNRELLTSLGRRLAYELELTLPAGRGSPRDGRARHRIAVTVRDDFRARWSTAVAAVGIEGTAGAAETPGPGSR